MQNKLKAKSEFNFNLETIQVKYWNVRLYTCMVFITVQSVIHYTTKAY